MYIRKGIKSDLPQVLELIQELADYEKAAHEVEITLIQLEEDGFGENPVYEFFVAENESEIVGIALYYFRYSTERKSRLPRRFGSKRLRKRKRLWTTSFRRNN